MKMNEYYSWYKDEKQGKERHLIQVMTVQHVEYADDCPYQRICENDDRNCHYPPHQITGKIAPQDSFEPDTSVHQLRLMFNGWPEAVRFRVIVQALKTTGIGRVLPRGSWDRERRDER